MNIYKNLESDLFTYYVITSDTRFETFEKVRLVELVILKLTYFNSLGF